MPKRISVTQENNKGRNEAFHDNFKNINMSRREFASRIKAGEYPNYHVRSVNGLDTSVSNPDKTKNNNLG